jgi:hypothetical protein
MATVGGNGEFRLKNELDERCLMAESASLFDRRGPRVKAPVLARDYQSGTNTSRASKRPESVLFPAFSSIEYPSQKDGPIYTAHEKNPPPVAARNNTIDRGSRPSSLRFHPLPAAYYVVRESTLTHADILHISCSSCCITPPTSQSSIAAGYV